METSAKRRLLLGLLKLLMNPMWFCVCICVRVHACVCVGMCAYFASSCSSLKICTVSVLLDAQRKWPSGLKDKELILTYLQTQTQHGPNVFA